MAEKNDKEPSPYECKGADTKKSTNIKELLAFCTHCKKLIPTKRIGMRRI